MRKRALLTAGGTGGHLFPAQHLAEDLTGWDVLFVAGGLSTNRYFNREHFLYQEVSCATLSFKRPWKLFKEGVKICSGIFESRRILKRFKPDVVVGFGSFFTLPVLTAALLMNIPIILHEQNAIPGKVNRLFAPFARLVTTTFPVTIDYLLPSARKKVVEVIFPCRNRAKRAENPWEYFGLQPEALTLLVFGGSQGAAKLNELFLEALPFLPHLQVLHFTGNEQRAVEVRQKYKTLNHPACVKAFEPRMDLAMQIAQCAVTRAGAATICELVEYELPAILIPFPFSAENHQDKNGEYFVIGIQGGEMYQETELNGRILAAAILELLGTRDEKKARIRSYQVQRKMPRLVDIIQEIAPSKS